LRLAVRFAVHKDSANNLRAAMESRTIIDIAVGVVMAQSRCSQEDAVRILTEASSNRNVKLRDIAKSVVDSVDAAGTLTHFEEPVQEPGRSRAG
jgi:AmiR/NasT family two-component response regulator